MSTTHHLARAAVVAVVAVIASMLVAWSAPGAASAADGDLSGVAPIEQRNEMTVTADPLPTVQLESGIVWTQVMNGNTVYAGGSFSQTRPAGAAPGTNLTPRSNLLAYDVRTGALLSFAPQINGTVKALALSPDGRTLYVGGSFTSVGSTTRFNLAAFDTATGALSETFKPAVGGSYVNAIVATDSTVYLGGLIGAVRGTTRKNLAAVSASNGALLGWAPTTDLQVDSMLIEPGGTKVIAAGRFATVNGVSQRGLAALDPVSGALQPWAVTNTVRNGRNDGSSNSGKAGIWAIAADGENVYGTGWVFANVATGNLEGLFAADGGTGDVVWIADCHGDHYGVYSDGTNVYSTGHEHECTTAGGMPQGDGTLRHATVYTAERKGTLTRSPFVNDIYADWSGYPAPAAVNWFPEWLTGTASGMGQAGWTVTGNDDYVVVGGEFVGVNNQRQQGLVRFARSPQGGANQGPRLSGAQWSPSARSLLPGTIDVSVGANWDRDDRDLTYELWEQGASQPTSSRTVASTYWNLPTVKLTAEGLEAGSSHTYRVRVVDGDGNSVTGDWVTQTVTSQAPSAYAQQVLADEPSLYWRFGASALGEDWIGANRAVLGSGVSSVATGATAGDQDGAAAFNGTASGTGGSTASQNGPNTYSVEAWFQASGTQSGKIVGFGNAQSGASSSYDRHVYLDSAGRVVYGNYPNQVKVVTSPAAYRDGEWHHVVATLGAAGMRLYVDGEQVGSDPSVTTAQAYQGYWRVGGDNLNGWPGVGSHNFAGRIDEVAVYPTALSAQQVAQHYAIGAGDALPTAAFTAEGSETAFTFDAAASEAPTGRTITAYAWDFGDGTAPASGITTTHTFDAPGTYQVTLTVTDSSGLTASTTQAVEAAAPHEPPTAVIGAVPDGLSVAFTGEQSSASGDAEIVEWAWDLGDGSTSDEPAPRHAYAAAGTYEVSLVVTDDTGAASDEATASVTVAHADPAASFEASVEGLQVAVDASASTASDGADLEYAWDWGDASAPATGPEATHVYVEPGTYTVTLTLTDALGGSATTSRTVVVSAEDVLAADGFARSVASGWGAADVGGTWSGTSGLSVADDAGVLTVGAGQTRRAVLDIGARAFDATFAVAPDRVADGGGLHINVAGLRTDAGEYRVKLRTYASGRVAAYLARVVGSTETVLASASLPADAAAADDVLRVRFAASDVGASTRLEASVWADGDAEPATWTLSAVDDTPALQVPGAFAVSAYASGSVTNGPVRVGFDDLVVRGEATAVHEDPVAVIAATQEGLAVAFDGAGSSAAAGSEVVAYAWQFGDGATSTEAAPAHTYGAAGAYEVTLTVTDDQGASASVTRAVQVTDEAWLAFDDFSRTAGTGWGDAETGGAWTTTAGASVADGVGVLQVGRSQTRRAALETVQAGDADVLVDLATDKVADGGGLHVNVATRRSTAGEYRAKLRISASGTVAVGVAKLVGGTETLLANRNLSGYTHAAGTTLRVRLQTVSDGAATTLRVKAWPADSAEPADWWVSSVDGEGTLQAPGHIAVSTYLTGSATNGPVTLSVDGFRVR